MSQKKYSAAKDNCPKKNSIARKQIVRKQSVINYFPNTEDSKNSYAAAKRY